MTDTYTYKLTAEISLKIENSLSNNLIFKTVMNKVQIFSSPEFGEIKVIDLNNEFYFLAVDVTRALGYVRAAKTVADHCNPKDVLKWDTPTNGGIQSMTYINESGLYALIMGSRLPQAQQFKHWVTSEVLPSIRKHGAYMTPKTIEEVLLSPDTIIKLATNLKEEHQRRVIAECKVAFLEEVTIENAPKVLFATAIEDSDEYCLVDVLAKVLKQNGIDMGQNRLFKWLHNHKYLCCKGGDKNHPTQKAMDLGIFRIVTHIIEDKNGRAKTKRTTKLTNKGLSYFVNKFLSKDRVMKS